MGFLGFGFVLCFLGLRGLGIFGFRWVSGFWICLWWFRVKRFRAFGVLVGFGGFWGFGLCFMVV